MHQQKNIVENSRESEDHKKATSSKKKSFKHTQRRPGAGKQISPKKRGRGPPVGRSVQKTRVTFQKPLAAGVIEHVESCLHASMLVVLNRKHSCRHLVQKQLTLLTQRLLCHCKNAKFPSTKLSNLKSLTRKMLAEQQMTQELEETMNSLDRELKEAVENANAANDFITDLEDKIKNLKQNSMESEKMKIITSNFNTLQLPKASYQAPTMQEKFQCFKNKPGLLKELGVMQATPVVDDLRRAIEKSYAEIDAL